MEHFRLRNCLLCLLNYDQLIPEKMMSELAKYVQRDVGSYVSSYTCNKKNFERYFILFQITLKQSGQMYEFYTGLICIIKRLTELKIR